MTDVSKSLGIIAMTAKIVAAYVSNHKMAQESLPAFIRQIHQSFNHLNSKQTFFFTPRSEPAVPIEKSMTPDYIICLEDGFQLKMLRRHLRAMYNMTPEQYRERWGLPFNYPMVAPNYAKRRRDIAKGVSLGHQKGRLKTVAA